MTPVRAPDPFAGWPDDYLCDACCAVGELVDVAGDRLCQACADKWAQSQRLDPDEAAELERDLRHAGLYRGVEIEARLYDGGAL